MVCHLLTESHYDVAQICMNGHVINTSSNTKPEFNKDFCTSCGEHTITSCKCSHQIKGYYLKNTAIGIINYERPSYCEKCGGPFPWTLEFLKNIDDVIGMIDELNDEEKTNLRSLIPHLIKETPSTRISIIKLKKFLSQVRSEIAPLLRSLIYDFASEATKKLF